MEACGTAHFWGRWLNELGFAVRLIPAHYARAYRRLNKNDAADAAALVEAARCAEIIDVPVKSSEQQGINLPAGVAAAVRAAPQFIDEADVPEALKTALLELVCEIRALEARMATIERQLQQHAKATPAVQAVQQVPGIGLLTATALVAAVGTPDHFRHGRHLAAWLGLTPRHVGSGHRMHLGGISKRGDRYLRMLFIHGARSVLIRAQTKARAGQTLTRLEQWALDLRQRSNHNKTTCALANKLARIAWAVWANERAFDGDYSLRAAA